MVNFADLKKDMEGEMRKIADFLEIKVDENKWKTIVEHCTFDYMKKNGEKLVPYGGVMWTDGHKTFMNKGINGRWAGKNQN